MDIVEGTINLWAGVSISIELMVVWPVVSQSTDIICNNEYLL